MSIRVYGSEFMKFALFTTPQQYFSVFRGKRPVGRQKWRRRLSPSLQCGAKITAPANLVDKCCCDVDKCCCERAIWASLIEATPTFAGPLSRIQSETVYIHRFAQPRTPDRQNLLVAPTDRSDRAIMNRSEFIQRHNETDYITMKPITCASIPFANEAPAQKTPSAPATTAAVQCEIRSSPAVDARAPASPAPASRAGTPRRSTS
jgi:hypothetical protein